MIEPAFSHTTHNGTFTVHNSATGVHRTFRIKTQKDDSNFAPGERVIAMLTGPDNTSDFRGFGFVKPDGRIAVWRAYRTDTWLANVRLIENLTSALERWPQLSVEWSVKCRQCNRDLTTPESIADGIGPICSGRQEG